MIKDTLLRLNLSLTRVRGQCYDRAANMAGIRSGVAKQLLEEPRAVSLTDKLDLITIANNFVVGDPHRFLVRLDL